VTIVLKKKEVPQPVFGKVVIIDGKSVEALSVAQAKSGKHGSAKSFITYIDPVTGRKMETVLKGWDQVTNIPEPPQPKNTLDILLLAQSST
jgi:hypothetical protein